MYFAKQFVHKIYYLRYTQTESLHFYQRQFVIAVRVLGANVKPPIVRNPITVLAVCIYKNFLKRRFSLTLQSGRL